MRCDKCRTCHHTKLELLLPTKNADGGIVITASHNPKQWNALKLLGVNGEFLNVKREQKCWEFAESGNFSFAEVDELGAVTEKDFTDIHVQKIIKLDLVDKAAIEAARFFCSSRYSQFCRRNCHAGSVKSLRN